ncbi:RNA methyltransferase [Fulvimarina sp. 2208YS6-2-32]|uniref:RNA methyltransferase n=1 Tax=Fulvimarina uroteuthidis TaxID=3098149 RepID=A0ABU5I725_9HYPH|nr:RNA methyltransferase [Fulvimarina sp. 2208YS6-2-32]MDY8109941.1 RNA methyltransferase [Fulvimarina sp. 2208YS6-2-32]
MASAIAPEPAHRFVPIDDPDDPRIAVFRDIRERDLTGRNGFIAEGTVVLDQLALSRRFRPTALLVLQNRLAGLAGRLAKLPHDCPVYVAGRDIVDAVAGFPMHRGVLAHGEDTGGATTREAAISAAFAQGAPILAAIGIANHDNIGALFRNARAFGVGGLLLDETSCHPLYRKALRVSVGTVLTQGWHRGGTAGEILAAVIAAGYRPIALTPGGTMRIEDLGGGRPCALFVGAEGTGLPAELLERMDGLRIAMDPSVDSLNVATSAAIVLSRLYASR